MFVLAGGKNFFPRVECACIWIIENMKLFLQTQPTNPSDGVEGLPLVYDFPLKAVGKRRIIGFEPPDVSSQTGFVSILPVPFIPIVLVPSRFEPLGRSTVFFLNSIILPCHCTDINNIFTFYLTFTFERTVLLATLTIAWIPIFLNSSRIILIVLLFTYCRLGNFFVVICNLFSKS